QNQPDSARSEQRQVAQTFAVQNQPDSARSELREGLVVSKYDIKKTRYKFTGQKKNLEIFKTIVFEWQGQELKIALTGMPSHRRGPELEAKYEVKLDDAYVAGLDVILSSDVDQQTWVLWSFNVFVSDSRLKKAIKDWLSLFFQKPWNDTAEVEGLPKQSELRTDSGESAPQSVFGSRNPMVSTQKSHSNLEDLNGAGRSEDRQVAETFAVPDLFDQVRSELRNSGVEGDVLDLETPIIAGLSDVQAILHYRDLIDRGVDVERNTRLLMKHARSLRQLLREVVDVPFQRLNALDDTMRTTLMDPDSEAMTLKHYLDIFLIPLFLELDKDPFSNPRISGGFPGTAAGGKTTNALKAKDVLAQIFRNRAFRLLEFDDFLREAGDRDPRETQDPYRKFNVGRYVEFVRTIMANELAVKPIYDQTSKGQLKLGINPQRDVVIYNGNRTITIQLEADGTFSFTEIWEAPGGPVDMTARRGKPHEKIKEAEPFISGSTPIAIRRLEDGTLEIKVRDAVHVIQKQDDLLFLSYTGYEKNKAPHVELKANEKQEALDVWPPVVPDPANGYNGEIVIGEGILLLEAGKYFNQTANSDASFFMRRRRSAKRELARGRSKEAIATTMGAFNARQYQEERYIERLNRLAIRERGRQSGHQTHFRVNSLTVPEHIVRDAAYHQIRARQIVTFLTYGINLEEMLKVSQSLADEALIHWIEEIRAKQLKDSKPLTHPGAFPGEDELTDQEAFLRYWRKKGITLALGQHLLLKTTMGDEYLIGSLHPESRMKLEKVFQRSQGLFVGTSFLNLKGRIGGEFLIERLHEDGRKTQHRVSLEEVLLINQVPFMEGILNEIAKEHETLLGKNEGEKAQAKYEEGMAWVRRFFDLQHEWYKRGIVDTAPDMARRYGLGIYHGRETIQGLAPGSLYSDEDALREVDRISEAHRSTSIPEVHRSLEGIASLGGFQKQFVMSAETGEDFLSHVPGIFRQGYVDLVREKIPSDKKTLMGFLDFGETWNRAVREGTQSELQNMEVSAVVMDDAKLNHIEEQLAGYFLRKAYDFFLEHFKEKKLDRAGNPHLAWAGLFLNFLPQDPNDALFVLTGKFYEMLLERPDWIERAKTGMASGDVAAKLIREVKAAVEEHYKELGDMPLVVRTWENNIFKAFVERAVRLSGTWENFYESGQSASGETRSEMRALDDQESKLPVASWRRLWSWGYWFESSSFAGIMGILVFIIFDLYESHPVWAVSLAVASLNILFSSTLFSKWVRYRHYDSFSQRLWFSPVGLFASSFVNLGLVLGGYFLAAKTSLIPGGVSFINASLFIILAVANIIQFIQRVFITDSDLLKNYDPENYRGLRPARIKRLGSQELVEMALGLNHYEPELATGSVLAIRELIRRKSIPDLLTIFARRSGYFDTEKVLEILQQEGRSLDVPWETQIVKADSEDLEGLADYVKRNPDIIGRAEEWAILSAALDKPRLLALFSKLDTETIATAEMLEQTLQKIAPVLDYLSAEDESDSDVVYHLMEDGSFPQAVSVPEAISNGIDFFLVGRNRTVEDLLGFFEEAKKMAVELERRIPTIVEEMKTSGRGPSTQRAVNPEFYEAFARALQALVKSWSRSEQRQVARMFAVPDQKDQVRSELRSFDVGEIGNLIKHFWAMPPQVSFSEVEEGESLPDAGYINFHDPAGYKKFIERLQELGEPAVQAVINEAKPTLRSHTPGEFGPDLDVKGSGVVAVRILGDLGAELAVPKLLYIVGSSSERENGRRIAVNSLKKIGGEAAVSGLVKLREESADIGMIEKNIDRALAKMIADPRAQISAQVVISALRVLEYTTVASEPWSTELINSIKSVEIKYASDDGVVQAARAAVNALSANQQRAELRAKRVPMTSLGSVRAHVQGKLDQLESALVDAIQRVQVTEVKTSLQRTREEIQEQRELFDRARLTAGDVLDFVLFLRARVQVAHSLKIRHANANLRMDEIQEITDEIIDRLSHLKISVAQPKTLLDPKARSELRADTAEVLKSVAQELQKVEDAYEGFLRTVSDHNFMNYVDQGLVKEVQEKVQWVANLRREIETTQTSFTVKKVMEWIEAVSRFHPSAVDGRQGAQFLPAATEIRASIDQAKLLLGSLDIVQSEKSAADQILEDDTGDKTVRSEFRSGQLEAQQEKPYDEEVQVTIPVNKLNQASWVNNKMIPIRQQWSFFRQAVLDPVFSTSSIDFGPVSARAFQTVVEGIKAINHLYPGTRHQGVITSTIDETSEGYRLELSATISSQTPLPSPETEIIEQAKDQFTQRFFEQFDSSVAAESGFLDQTVQNYGWDIQFQLSKDFKEVTFTVTVPSRSEIRQRKNRQEGVRFPLFKWILRSLVAVVIVGILAFGAGCAETVRGVTYKDFVSDIQGNQRHMIDTSSLADGPVKKAVMDLRSDDFKTREAALKTLDQMGSEAQAAIPALVVTLDDETQPIRYDAAQLLMKLGWQPGSPGQREKFEIARKTLDELVAMGESAVDILARDLRFEEQAMWKHSGIRNALDSPTAKALVKIGGPRVAQVFLDSLNIDNPVNDYLAQVSLRAIASETQDPQVADIFNAVLKAEKATFPNRSVKKAVAGECLKLMWPASQKALPAMIDDLKTGSPDFAWILMRDPESAKQAAAALVQGLLKYRGQTYIFPDDGRSEDIPVDRFREEFLAEVDRAELLGKLDQLNTSESRLLKIYILETENSGETWTDAGLYGGLTGKTDERTYREGDGTLFEDVGNIRNLFPEIVDERHAFYGYSTPRRMKALYALEGFDPRVVREAFPTISRTLLKYHTYAAQESALMQDDRHRIALANESTVIKLMVWQGDISLPRQRDVHFSWSGRGNVTVKHGGIHWNYHDIARLRILTQSPIEYYRRGAQKALAAIEKQSRENFKADDAIFAALKDKKRIVQNDALLALGMRPDLWPKAIPELTAMLNVEVSSIFSDPIIDIVAQLLTDIGKPAVPVLTDLIMNRTLREIPIGSRSGKLQMRRFPELPYGAGDAILATLIRIQGPEAFPVLEDFFTYNGLNDGHRILSALEDLGEPGFLPLIRIATRDYEQSIWPQGAQDIIVRKQAVMMPSLMEFFARNQTRTDLDFYHTKPIDDHIETIFKRMPELVIPYLIKNLTHERGKVRGSSADQLGDIGDESVIPALERVAQIDPDAMVRFQANRAITSIKNRAEEAQRRTNRSELRTEEDPIQKVIGWMTTLQELLKTQRIKADGTTVNYSGLLDEPIEHVVNREWEAALWHMRSLSETITKLHLVEADVTVAVQKERIFNLVIGAIQSFNTDGVDPQFIDQSKTRDVVARLDRTVADLQPSATSGDLVRASVEKLQNAKTKIERGAWLGALKQILSVREDLKGAGNSEQFKSALNSMAAALRTIQNDSRSELRKNPLGAQIHRASLTKDELVKEIDGIFGLSQDYIAHKLTHVMENVLGYEVFSLNPQKGSPAYVLVISSDEENLRADLFLVQKDKEGHWGYLQRSDLPLRKQITGLMSAPRESGSFQFGMFKNSVRDERPSHVLIMYNQKLGGEFNRFTISEDIGNAELHFGGWHRIEQTYGRAATEFRVIEGRDGHASFVLYDGYEPFWLQDLTTGASEVIIPFAELAGRIQKQMRYFRRKGFKTDFYFEGEKLTLQKQDSPKSIGASVARAIHDMMWKNFKYADRARFAVDLAVKDSYPSARHDIRISVFYYPENTYRKAKRSEQREITADKITIGQETLRAVTLTRDLLKRYRKEIFELLKMLPTDHPYHIEQSIDSIIDNPQKFNPDLSVVVFDGNNQPVGFVIMTDKTQSVTLPDAGVYLSKIGLHPRLRGSGAAVWLLYQAFTRAWDHNLLLAQLLVVADNAQAIRFYEKAGGQRLSEVPPRVAAKIPNIKHYLYEIPIQSSLGLLEREFARVQNQPDSARSEQRPVARIFTVPDQEDQARSELRTEQVPGFHLEKTADAWVATKAYRIGNTLGLHGVPSAKIWKDVLNRYLGVRAIFVRSDNQQFSIKGPEDFARMFLNYHNPDIFHRLGRNVTVKLETSSIYARDHAVSEFSKVFTELEALEVTSRREQGKILEPITDQQEEDQKVVRQFMWELGGLYQNLARAREAEERQAIQNAINDFPARVYDAFKGRGDYALKDDLQLVSQLHVGRAVIFDNPETEFASIFVVTQNDGRRVFFKFYVPPSEEVPFGGLGMEIELLPQLKKMPGDSRRILLPELEVFVEFAARAAAEREKWEKWNNVLVPQIEEINRSAGYRGYRAEIIRQQGHVLVKLTDTQVPDTHLTIMVDQGFRVISWMVDGKERLSVPKNLNSLGAGIFLMGPFVNRIKDGIITRNGKTYDISKIQGLSFDGKTPNPIHGIFRIAEWKDFVLGADKNGVYVTANFETSDYPDPKLEEAFGYSKTTVTFRLNARDLGIDVQIEGEEGAIADAGPHPFLLFTPGETTIEAPVTGIFPV
ncbi:MAG: GNAT family N-acetyltransferase, partial [Candidatus Omnitrophica bacterium]|nr:GNAT family N-acetyltransferase [Candidatus Omnitrophota bacterium]